MKKIFTCIYFTLAITLSGCASLNGPKYSSLPELKRDGASTLVIYRVPSLKGAAWPHHIYINGQLVAKLNSGGITSILVYPGNHIVSQGPENDPTFKKVAIAFESGKTYYVEHNPGRDLYTPGSFQNSTAKPSSIGDYIYQAPTVEFYKGNVL
ncbi:MAG: hypothetical protein RL497_2938 [Pseudomonadota bacterium]|jgi:hypothetical protein